MTKRDTFFTEDEYQQYVYTTCVSNDANGTPVPITTVPPAILKPKKLWTGKQIVSHNRVTQP